MAEHDEVRFRALHGKLVRVYPERYDPHHTELSMTCDGKTVSITREEAIKSTIQFANEKGYPSGTVAKVVMTSRLGDCGLSKHLRAEHGYNVRLYPECLEIVPDEEVPRLLHQWDVGQLNGDQGPKKKLTLAEKRRRKA